MDNSGIHTHALQAANPQLECGISIIPAEILLRIFRFLENPKDLFNALLVCKLWSEVVHDQTLWKRLCLKKQKICRIDSYKGDWRRFYREHLAKRSAVSRILIQCPKNEKNKFVIADPITQEIYPFSLSEQNPNVMMQQGTWSPGGDKVAVTRLIPGDDRECEVVILNSNGKETASYKSPYPSFYYFWSPDNTRVLFLSNYQTSDFAFDIGLQYLDLILEKENKTSLLDIGRPYFYSWNPFGSPEILAHIGGKGLAIVEFHGEEKETNFDMKKKEVVRADVNDPKKGHVMTDMARFPAPFWVPQVGSLEASEFIYPVVVRDNLVTTSPKVNIVAAIPRPPITKQEWSSLSVKSLRDYLQFYKIDSSNAVEKSELVDLLVDHTSSLVFVQEKVLCTLENHNINYVVSKDGTKIAMDAEEKALYVLDRKVQTNSLKKIHEQVYAYFWSPDSRYLLYLTQHEEFTSNEMNWWIYDSFSGDCYISQPFKIGREFANNYLPFFTQYSQSLTFFSPDSKSYVFCDEGVVYISGVEKDAKREKIFSGTFATWSPK